MKTLLLVLIVSAVGVALMMAGLGIKMLCRRSHDFRRPCTNSDPKTGHCTHCTCGKRD